MSTTRLQMVPDLPWSVSPEDQRRFRNVLFTVLLTLLFFGIVMPFIPVPEETLEEQAELPPRLARLVLERKQEQAPPPPAPVVEEPEPEPEPEPKAEEPKPEELPEPVEEPPEPPRQVEQPETAREKAARSGLLAFKDQLADLRDNSVLESVSRRSITTEGTQARQVERSIVTEGISQGSGGINTAALSRDTGGTGLAGRATSQIESPVGDGSGGGGGEGASTGAGGQGEGASGRGSSGQGRRSEENVQITFDRNKSAIDNIYNRALRKNPALQGKVVVKLTIAPSGKVTACTIISSELNDPALERKLVQRIKLLNFGPEDVATTTVNYPINFFPA